MNRSSVVALIAVGLAGYGVYAASFLPGLMIGPPVFLLLGGFLIQAILAFLAAVGVWSGRGWAARSIVGLGAAIAVTWLIEGFALGLVASLYALGVALLAVIVCVVAAAYVSRA